MSFEYFIGARYLRARQKQAFITLILFLSVAGITVGVMALIVVMAVMTGFDVDLRMRILGGQPHIIVKHRDGALGEYDRALGYLDQAVEHGFVERALYEDDPDLRPLHGRAEWVELLARLGESRAAG